MAKEKKKASLQQSSDPTTQGRGRPDRGQSAKTDSLKIYSNNQIKTKNPVYTGYSKLDEIRLITVGLASSNRILQWAEKSLPNGKIVGEVTNANTLHHKTFKPVKGGLFCERIFGPLKDFECACSSSLGKKISKLKLGSDVLVTRRSAKTDRACIVGTDHAGAADSPLTLQEQQGNLSGSAPRMQGHETTNHSNSLNMQKPIKNSLDLSVFNGKRFFCPVCDVEYTWSVVRRYQLGYIKLNAPVTHVWYLKGNPSFISLLLDMKKKQVEYVTYCTETLTLENAFKFSAENLYTFDQTGLEAQPNALFSVWNKVSGNSVKQKNTLALEPKRNMQGQQHNYAGPVSSGSNTEQLKLVDRMQATNMQIQTQRKLIFTNRLKALKSLNYYLIGTSKCAGTNDIKKPTVRSAGCMVNPTDLLQRSKRFSTEPSDHTGTGRPCMVESDHAGQCRPQDYKKYDLEVFLKMQNLSSLANLTASTIKETFFKKKFLLLSNDKTYLKKKVYCSLEDIKTNNWLHRVEALKRLDHQPCSWFAYYFIFIKAVKKIGPSGAAKNKSQPNSVCQPLHPRSATMQADRGCRPVSDSAWSLDRRHGRQSKLKTLIYALVDKLTVFNTFFAEFAIDQRSKGRSSGRSDLLHGRGRPCSPTMQLAKKNFKLSRLGLTKFTDNQASINLNNIYLSQKNFYNFLHLIYIFVRNQDKPCSCNSTDKTTFVRSPAAATMQRVGATYLLRRRPCRTMHRSHLVKSKYFFDSSSRIILRAMPVSHKKTKFGKRLTDIVMNPAAWSPATMQPVHSRKVPYSQRKKKKLPYVSTAAHYFNRTGMVGFATPSQATKQRPDLQDRRRSKYVGQSLHLRPACMVADVASTSDRSDHAAAAPAWSEATMQVQFKNQAGAASRPCMGRQHWTTLFSSFSKQKNTIVAAGSRSAMQVANVFLMNRLTNFFFKKMLLGSIKKDAFAFTPDFTTLFCSKLALPYQDFTTFAKTIALNLEGVKYFDTMKSSPLHGLGTGCIVAGDDTTGSPSGAELSDPQNEPCRPFPTHLFHRRPCRVYYPAACLVEHASSDRMARMQDPTMAEQKRAKLSTLVNNIYCLSHRLLWDNDKNWQFFAFYYYGFYSFITKTPFLVSDITLDNSKESNSNSNSNSNSKQVLTNTPLEENFNNSQKAFYRQPFNLEDKAVPEYAYRNYENHFSLLNTFFSRTYKVGTDHIGTSKKPNLNISLTPSQLHVSFSGAGMIKALLADYNYAELKKMDKQNRILLYDLNKYIRILKKQLTYNKKLIKVVKEFYKERDILIRRTKYIRRIFKNYVSYSLGNSLLDSLGTNSNLKKKVLIASASSLPTMEAQQKFLKNSVSNKPSLQGTGQFRPTSDHASGRFRPTGDHSATNLNNMGRLADFILDVLPVLPPDLRPIVKMGSQIAASDLNRLYQRVIYRNDRLKKFLKNAATNGSYEMKYVQRLLQEAVDNLIQNGKSGVVPEKDARGRALKSLSEILKGKQGRFRQYLLGKRVDYSGRSVIVVGPKLKLHECGIPKEMALELYLPFLIKSILNKNLARTVIGAKALIQNNKPLTWSLLREILKTCPVLLNRAPTLHRLGFQAFQPKLVDGKAILLHPLVCPAFNADFDGDQMAVHVPISAEARAEAWKLMLSRNNLLSPATGEPLVLPSQDMVLGCYYLTTNGNKRTQEFEKGFGFYFESLNDVLRAYNQGLLSIHAIIWVKWNAAYEQVVNIEAPLEMRLNIFGSAGYVIYPKSYKTFQIQKQVNVGDPTMQSQPSKGPLLYTGIVDAGNAATSTNIHNNGILDRMDPSNKWATELILINNVIRTTPGKILFNVMIQKSLA